MQEIYLKQYNLNTYTTLIFKNEVTSYLKSVFTLNSFSSERILKEKNMTFINSHVYRHTTHIHTHEIVSTTPQKSTKSKSK